MTIINQSSTALIVVDVQNDFITGSLAVANAKSIITPINELAKHFEQVIITQDYHPHGHISFASTHQQEVLSQIDVDYGKQTLWVNHCVQGEFGANLDDELDVRHAKLIIRKGCRQAVDSYSAFIEADGLPTGLDGYLRQLGIDTVYVVGIATDYCVAWTAIDAAKLGYDCVVVLDATVAIDHHDSLANAMMAMKQAGVSFVNRSQLLG